MENLDIFLLALFCFVMGADTGRPGGISARRYDRNVPQAEARLILTWWR